MRITFIVSNCRYISANMHYGSHISWGWSSTECIWTSCQAPQFFSWCDSRNFLHLWRQNHRRVLCWPWSRLSTVSCVRSSLRIWGKKTRETSRNISFRNYTKYIHFTTHFLMLYILKMASAYILYLEKGCKPNLMSTTFVNRKVFLFLWWWDWRWHIVLC